MGKRGPAPQPRQLKIAKGTLQACREPKNPVKTPLATPLIPKGLTKPAQVHWKRLVGQLEPWGILTPADGEILRMLSIAFVHHDKLAADVDADGMHMESSNQNGDVKRYKNPDVSSLSEVRVFIRQCLGEFGMSPSSRSRIDMGDGDDPDPDIERFFA